VRYAARRAAAGFFLAVAALPSPASAAADDGVPAPLWSVELRSARHSDALSLDAIDRDAWSELRPRDGRNLTYLDEEVRLAWWRGSLGVAMLARQYATLVASADALRLVAQVSGRQSPAADQTYGVDVKLRGFSGAGFALGMSGAIAAGWRWHGELQALGLGRWVRRDIEGLVRYGAADGSYEFDLHSFELDNRLDFPFQQPFARRGAAVLSAVSLTWQGERTWVRAELRDGGWLYWRGVPQQTATLSTATASVDDDGFVIYLPLVQGYNAQDGRREWMPWRGSVAAGLSVGRTQEVGLRVETVPGFGALPVLAWRHLPGNSQEPAFGAEWRVHERRLELRASWRGLTLGFGADRLGSGAHSRQATAAFATAF
jgi:hypothetical protein